MNSAVCCTLSDITDRMGVIPHFENPEGFSLDLHHYEGLIFKKAIYEYQADLLHPLTFVSYRGTCYRPDNHFLTDMASIPQPLQAIPGFSKDRHLLPAIIHDSAYCHGGLFIKYYREDKFHFQAMARQQVDDLFRLMCQFDIAPSPLLSWVYWLGVRLGGGFSWKRGDYRRKA